MEQATLNPSDRLCVITENGVELKLRIHKTKNKEDGQIHLFRYQWYKVTGGGTPTEETDDLALIVGVFMLGGGVRFSTKISNTQLAGWKMQEIFIDDVEIKSNYEIQNFLRDLFQKYFPDFPKNISENQFPIKRPTRVEPDTNILREFGRKVLDKIGKINCVIPAGIILDTPLQKTTVETIVKARRGQFKFRANLDALWKNKCAVTGCSIREALRASHALPWAECNDKQRLDPFNGLLLVSNLDALFDKFLITFDKDGAIRISETIRTEDRAALGINEEMKLRRIDEKHHPYLEEHRKRFEEMEEKRKKLLEA